MDEETIVREMRRYIETRCVSEEYLREVLGDQSVVIYICPRGLEEIDENL
ncbi:MAG: hypothetical protein V1889_02380 [archaeon]